MNIKFIKKSYRLRYDEQSRSELGLFLFWVFIKKSNLKRFWVLKRGSRLEEGVLKSKMRFLKSKMSILYAENCILKSKNSRLKSKIAFLYANLS